MLGAEFCCRWRLGLTLDRYRRRTVPIVRSKLADVKRALAFALLCLAAALLPANDGRAQDSAGPVETALKALLTNAAVAKALEEIKADDARTLAEQRRITEIPAPPFKEQTRAQFYLQRLHDLGLGDAAIDGEGMSSLCARAAAAGRNSSSPRTSIRYLQRTPTSPCAKPTGCCAHRGSATMPVASRHSFR